MDYRPLLKAAKDRDFGAFEEGLKAVLFAKSLEALNERATELTVAISEDREPTDMANMSPSLFLPNLKRHVAEDDVSFAAALPTVGKTVDLDEGMLDAAKNFLFGPSDAEMRGEAFKKTYRVDPDQITKINSVLKTGKKMGAVEDWTAAKAMDGRALYHVTARPGFHAGLGTHLKEDIARYFKDKGVDAQLGENFANFLRDVHDGITGAAHEAGNAISDAASDAGEHFKNFVFGKDGYTKRFDADWNKSGKMGSQFKVNDRVTATGNDRFRGGTFAPRTGKVISTSSHMSTVLHDDGSKGEYFHHELSAGTPPKAYDTDTAAPAFRARA